MGMTQKYVTQSAAYSIPSTQPQNYAALEYKQDHLLTCERFPQSSFQAFNDTCGILP